MSTFSTVPALIVHLRTRLSLSMVKRLSFLNNNFFSLELFTVHLFNSGDGSFVLFKVDEGVVTFHFNLIDSSECNESISEIFSLAFTLNLGNVELNKSGAIILLLSFFT